VPTDSVINAAGKPILMNALKLIGYPARWAIPAVTILFVAPIRELFAPKADPIDKL
jgi:hypothetical protein